MLLGSCNVSFAESLGLCHLHSREHRMGKSGSVPTSRDLHLVSAGCLLTDNWGVCVSNSGNAEEGRKSAAKRKEEVGLPVRCFVSSSWVDLILKLFEGLESDIDRMLRGRKSKSRSRRRRPRQQGFSSPAPAIRIRRQPSRKRI